MSITPEQLPQDTSNGDADLETIASSLLEDVGEVNRLRKDERREDAPPADEEVAVEPIAEELSSTPSIHHHERMAQSLATAVETDQALIEELEQTNHQILQDRALAIMLDQEGEVYLHPSIPAQGTSIAGTSRQPQSVQSSKSTASTSQAPDNDNRLPNVSRPASPSEQHCVPKPIVPCTICTDLTEESDISLPCTHTYHVACAVQLFEAAIKDESLLPPCCCSIPIPVELVTPHLSATSAALFTEKLQEHQTPNRLYCPKASCSQFIGSAQTELAEVRCAKCSTLVCPTCKSFAHPRNVLCPSDMDSQKVLDLAESQGWKRCPGCSTMVELKHGCYHMTCLCRTEFCYLCATPWKKCNCKKWDEARLIVTT